MPEWSYKIPSFVRAGTYIASLLLGVYALSCVLIFGLRTGPSREADA